MVKDNRGSYTSLNSNIKRDKITKLSFKKIVWITLTIVLLFFTDFGKLLINDKDNKLNKPFKYIAYISFSVFLCCIFYITIYLPKIKKVKVDYNDWQHNIKTPIQITTVSIILSYISSSIAFWPVYGFFSFIIILICCLGGVSIVALL
ncbi:hypothetical protein BCR32DRAFT_294743 [Anaeromyces robustus]|uniref:Uncharacterized protein n=1 Tax=Anaeromyces robustus TaxID=1754192 RepID=A0A1Y1WZQ8_9FUNG|nr:hypothetical protein BCR32DRAFT_294743 [Anaeromyces robustus]|eukprot:ORX78922.1 hypothetical protein BCR32DRAFT_294743 [Anaeromyces robustus]